MGWVHNLICFIFLRFIFFHYNQLNDFSHLKKAGTKRIPIKNKTRLRRNPQ